MELKLAVPEKRVIKPFFTVDYQESHPETYQGVKVECMGKEETFFSGDFKKDINDAFEKYPVALCSSTVDSYMRETGIQFEEGE